MKALDEYFLMAVVMLLLNTVHVFANFMFNLSRERRDIVVILSQENNQSGGYNGRCVLPYNGIPSVKHLDLVRNCAKTFQRRETGCDICFAGIGHPWGHNVASDLIF